MMRLTLASLSVLAVVVVGTAGFVVIGSDDGPVSVIDALFMTVITVSTVGFAEIVPPTPAMRAWTILTIAFGIVTVSYAFGSLVSVVVSGELRSEQLRKRMEKNIESLSNHVVVCGYGRMGRLVARMLQETGLDVVVVEATPGQDLIDSGVPYIAGDGTDEETLHKAGLGRALVVAFPTDADSVFLTLTAHAIYPNLPIIARAEQQSTEPKLRRAGASRVICPQEIGAMKVAHLITRPSVVDFVEIASQGVDLEIDEYHIRSSSAFAGKKLSESKIRDRTGAIVVAVKRRDGETIVSPNGRTPLEAQDVLILVGAAGIGERIDALPD